MPRQIALPNLNLSTGPLTVVNIVTTREVTAIAGDLPIGDTSGEQIRTLARVVVPVAAGDVLDISGRQRVTNDVGPIWYGAGVGFWFDIYDMDDGATSADRMWTRIGSLNGTNVDRKVIHHAVLPLEDVWQVVPEWPAGHRMVVCFRADAHSTLAGANGPDKITVDDYGVLTVRQYRPPVDDPRVADLEARVADLEARVAALEAAG